MGTLLKVHDPIECALKACGFPTRASVRKGGVPATHALHGANRVGVVAVSDDQSYVWSRAIATLAVHSQALTALFALGIVASVTDAF